MSANRRNFLYGPLAAPAVAGTERAVCQVLNAAGEPLPPAAMQRLNVAQHTGVYR